MELISVIGMLYSSRQDALPYGVGAMGSRNVAVEYGDIWMLQSEKIFSLQQSCGSFPGLGMLAEG